MLGFEFDALIEQARRNADELEKIDEKIRQDIDGAKKGKNLGDFGSLENL